MARQALILPDPIDDWLGGIASDTGGLTEKAVTSELNAIWRADILPFCQAALNNRYPFSPDSAVDVNVKDFARLFGPGGLIDAFINDHLISYVDTTNTAMDMARRFRPRRQRAEGLRAGAAHSRRPVSRTARVR